MNKKLFTVALMIVGLAALSACSSGNTISGNSGTNGVTEEANESGVPKDFSFALTWNCYGVSSYDSQTGKLIKTTDATNPEDYITDYRLTEEDRKYFYDLIETLDVNAYPTVYDPGNGMSEPSMTLILTVTVNGETKTIKSEDIAISYASKDAKGQKFLSVCKEIADKLTATEEWEALPEYEVFYD